jgi:DNA polymerase-3 subunit delta
MKIRSEQLSNQLSKKLEPIYFVFGAEILLIEQSLLQIKSAAKSLGFDERVSFEIDGNFQWDLLHSEIAAGSLFSPKRIIECRLKSGKIGIKGSKSLTEISQTLPQDILLIISTGKLDMNQQKSKWFKSLEKNAAIVQHWEVNSEHLVGWITNHMAQIGLETNKEVAQSIAFCTEGNLLASMQEIQKLSMAYPNGNIDTKSYIEQTYQQSKYTVYGLIDAALSGDSDKTMKIFDTMIDDVAFPIQLNNSLYRELKSIIAMAIELQEGSNIDEVLQSHRVWSKRKSIISNTLKRQPYQRLQKLLLSIGRIDRSIKGMDNLTPSIELRTVLLNLSGKTQWAQ